MTPGSIDDRVISQRATWVLEMIDSLKELPVQNKKEFIENKHIVAAAESYLRRSLEALFDIGRHILAKKFAYPAAEYKEIVKGLEEKRILTKEEAERMRKMAGYRNRMVHFYHEITSDELQDICVNHLEEIHSLLNSLLRWIKAERNGTH